MRAEVCQICRPQLSLILSTECERISYLQKVRLYSLKEIVVI